MNPYINVPYIGMDEAGSTTHNFATFAFKGLVDHRRIKRMVRRRMNSILDRTIHTSEILSVTHNRRITHAESVAKGSTASAPIPVEPTE